MPIKVIELSKDYSFKCMYKVTNEIVQLHHSWISEYIGNIILAAEYILGLSVVLSIHP